MNFVAMAINEKIISQLEGKLRLLYFRIIIQLFGLSSHAYDGLDGVVSRMNRDMKLR